MKLTDVAYTLTLAAAFAWSSAAFGVNCACEVATGACAECCGAQDAGFKHCGIDGGGGPRPPAVLSVPYQYDKAMPAPAELPATAAPAAPEAAPEPHAAGGKAGTKPTSKPPIQDKTPDSTGKGKP